MTPRRSLALLLASCASISGCGKIERISGVAPLQARRLVAQGTVTTDAGGRVAPTSATALHAGVSLAIPPGAVATEQHVEIWVRYGDPRLPSVVQSFELEPRGLVLAIPATIVVEYSRAYELTAGEIWSELGIAAWSFVDDPAQDLSLRPSLDLDLERNLLTSRVDRLGTVFCVHKELRSLALPEASLVDPAVEVRAELLGNQPVASVDGRQSIRIGKGTLDGFFVGDVSSNLLVVPGAFGQALQITGNDGMFPPDVAAGLNGDFVNIVAFGYPAGHAIRDNGNRLYDAIRSRAAAGFGCCALAHGGGGLVLRWALERAHLDPERIGYQETDPPLSESVDRVVFLATPNDGAPAAALRFDAILAAVQTQDQRFVQGLADLVPLPGGIVDVLNSGHAPGTRYFVIAGNVAGGGSDGFVEVSSALGSAGPNLGAESHLVFSGTSYDHFALLAAGGRTGVANQSRVWFGKSFRNNRPVVAAVVSPAGVTAGVVTVPYSLADAEGDNCVVAAVYTLDGGNWAIATPAGGGGYIESKSSLPAPGFEHVFHWNSVADGVGLQTVERAVLRIVAADDGGYGVVGDTGWFQIQNR